MWYFAVGLYLVQLGGLRLAAIFGFTCGGLILLLGGLIGDWVDRNGRLKGASVVDIKHVAPYCLVCHNTYSMLVFS